MPDKETFWQLWLRISAITGGYPDKGDSVEQVLEDLLHKLAQENNEN